MRPFPPLMPLVRASHPEPALAVTTVSVLLAVQAGRGALGALAVGAAIGCGQLSVGWSNDYLDSPRDAAAGRRDKPLAGGSISTRAVATAAGAALAGAVGLSFASGWRAALAHLGALAMAWSYNARLKATPASVLAYAIAFGLLPAFVTLGLPGSPLPHWWAMAAGALLGAGAHFANTLPDLDVDRAQGVLGLPQRLGRRAGQAAGLALLLAATAVLAVGPGTPGPASWLLLAAALALAVGGAVLAHRRPSSRLTFLAVLAMAVLDVAFLLVRGTRI